ncbi:MAG: restriction endonuclease, partial [Bacteroidales bacterium]|nr:restriction endonuclease [Bacteroidales bacterium]
MSNTTAIGTEFENKVFDMFSSLLEKDEVPNANKKYSKILSHQKYQCLGITRQIDFEITIENYNPHSNSTTWSSLIVIECKNYKNKVDIADLDEFSSKINKISKSGIKGIMVSTIGFSKNAIEQAQSEHIALIVVNPNNDLEWIVSRDLNKYPEQLWEFLIGNNKTDGLPIVYDDHHFSNIE